MSTDRELLELAAKAADYWSSEFNCPANLPHLGWNPLDRDGDALRLAVKLCMSLLIGDGGTVAACIDSDERSVKAVERYMPNPDAATRRAIVRAAAEIGRAS
jgi:hypothetical protein